MLPEDLDKLTKEERIDLYDKLTIVFKKTLNRFKYVPDIVLWDVLDHWETYKQIPDSGIIEGDCDCFALACRKECHFLNIPSRLLFCTVFMNNRRSGHLVLECAGFILDCRQKEVVVNNQLTDYLWVSISGYNTGDPWCRVYL